MQADPTFEAFEDQQEIESLFRKDAYITHFDIKELSPSARDLLSETLEAQRLEILRKLKSMDSSDHGWVYFVSDGKFVKVGWCTVVTRRMRALQTGNRGTLKLLFAISAESIAVESAIHNRLFVEGRVRHGEWFSLTDSDIKAIKKLYKGRVLECNFYTPRRTGKLEKALQYLKAWGYKH